MQNLISKLRSSRAPPQPPSAPSQELDPSPASSARPAAISQPLMATRRTSSLFRRLPWAKSSPDAALGHAQGGEASPDDGDGDEQYAMRVTASLDHELPPNVSAIIARPYVSDSAISEQMDDLHARSVSFSDVKPKRDQALLEPSESSVDPNSPEQPSTAQPALQHTHSPPPPAFPLPRPATLRRKRPPPIQTGQDDQFAGEFPILTPLANVEHVRSEPPIPTPLPALLPPEPSSVASSSTLVPEHHSDEEILPVPRTPTPIVSEDSPLSARPALPKSGTMNPLSKSRRAGQRAAKSGGLPTKPRTGILRSSTPMAKSYAGLSSHEAAAKSRRTLGPTARQVSAANLGNVESGRGDARKGTTVRLFSFQNGFPTSLSRRQAPDSDQPDSSELPASPPDTARPETPARDESSISRMFASLSRKKFQNAVSNDGESPDTGRTTSRRLRRRWGRRSAEDSTDNSPEAKSFRRRSSEVYDKFSFRRESRGSTPRRTRRGGSLRSSLDQRASTERASTDRASMERASCYDWRRSMDYSRTRDFASSTDDQELSTLNDSNSSVIPEEKSQPNSKHAVDETGLVHEDTPPTNTDNTLFHDFDDDTDTFGLSQYDSEFSVPLGAGADFEEGDGEKARGGEPVVTAPPGLALGDDPMIRLPSFGPFRIDGGLEANGFIISSDGIQATPDEMFRQVSTGSSMEGVPRSSHATFLVTDFKELRVQEMIGRGQCSKVFKARHLPSGKNVAVKQINVFDESMRNQMLKELETYHSHASRFLVRSYGAFYDEGAVKIILEYMDCGSLAAVIAKHGAIPERVTMVIAYHCLHGLRQLHRSNTLHRDLKSGNILISREFRRAKLSDFGLARDVGKDQSLVDSFVGTLAYMAPERLQGRPYSKSSDIWAFGIIIAECLRGRYPFKKSQCYFDYVAEAAFTQNLLCDDGEECQFSPECVDFVNRCTKVDPLERPTADECIEWSPWMEKAKYSRPDVFPEWLDEVDSGL